MAKAKYDFFIKRRFEAMKAVKEVIDEKKLMTEMMSSTGPVSMTRKSLVL